MAHRFTLALGIGLLAATAALPACSPRAEDAPAATARAASPSGDAHTFTIGALQAIALRDGAVQFPNDNKVFGIGHTPGQVAAVLHDAGLPTDQLHLDLAPLMVKTADRVLLFDTGAGGNFGAGAGHLATSLAAAGIDPGSITDIFISHVHGDHVGGLVGVEDMAVFPHATIHISQPEWAFLKSQTSASAGNLGISNFDALMTAMTPGVAPFAPGATIIPGAVSAVEIKGHTPGHSGYLIRSGEDSLLYIGDAMHHYVVSVQQPDWANGFDADQSMGITSRSGLLAQGVATGQRIYALHFPFPGLGRFEKTAAGFRWSAE